jgi:L-alanine-DL-glutamate epimerase-like enolase superfamily enzyme
MKIKSLRAFQIHIPFKMSFSHAHLKRKSSQNIIVETVLDSGVKGYGESLPRDYVTGETPEGVLKVYEKLDLDSLSRNFQNYDQVVDCLKNYRFLKDESRNDNAARCAFEMSVLDAFSKQFKTPILSFYAEAGRDGDIGEKVPVSGIISLGRIEKLMAYLSWIKLMGFKQVKVKVSGDVKKDLKRLCLISRALGQTVQVRADANMAYNFESALEFLREARKYGVESIEDPLITQDLYRLPELKALTNAEIILDEPVCTLQEVKKFMERSYFDTINIRISKCGGFIRSFEIADYLWENGKSVQLGCQVGETGILTAAGWHFMRNFGCLKYYEGGYDSYLLSRNVIKEKFSIKKGGELKSDLSDSGLGITVLEDRLMSLKPQEV